ncbi:MAG: response regulator transcription factor, partial [Actinobacteria bacterium]|nr:response regulator transcription factor [Actinomycetota bacterium]
MKVLVADGDADHLAGVVTWLRTHGYEVKHALTAERFRVSWIDYKPDLVVVQHPLAGVDTLDLCRDLRLKHDALVLAIATEPDAGTHIRCLESGADACVTKPFVPAMLLAHIHALTRRRQNP